MKLSAILGLLVLTAPGKSQILQDSSKSVYHLFYPTPENRLRSFETDRPDATESAYTVDAGHFQFETDLVKTTRSSAEGIKTIQNQFNAFNLKAGITNTLDFEFILESFVTEKVIQGGSAKEESGIGNITLRAKQNLWGNDHGNTAMAILPFINIPTGSGSKVSGGMILPFALSLSNDWGFGSQIEIDIQDNQLTRGYHFNFLASCTISHPVFTNFNMFAETLIYRENELKNYEYFINTGLVFKLTKAIRIDTGVYYGIKSTSSKTCFIGLSYRY